MSDNALRIYTFARGSILKSAIALLTGINLCSILWVRPVKADDYTQPAEIEQCVVDGLRQPAAKEVAILDGGIFIGFGDDGQRLETQSTQDNDTTAYNFNGEKIAEAEEGFFSGNSHIVVAEEDAPVYDLGGREVGGFLGGISLSLNVGEYLVTASFIREQSVLYDSLGNVVAMLQGIAISADEESILTTSYTDDSTLLYNLEGEELVQFEGIFSSIEEESYFATSSSSTGRAYLFDQKGQHIADAEGASLIFSRESMRIATSPRANETGALYDLNNNKIADIVGYASGFSEDGRWLTSANSDSRQTYLYDAMTGREIAALEGVYSEFTRDESYLIAYSYGGFTKLYDLAGNEVADFVGTFHGFSEDGERLLTESTKDKQVYLYNLLGERLGVFDGKLETSFNDITKAGKGFLVHNAADDRTYLYDFSGSSIASFVGSSFRFSSDGQWLVASSYNDDCSRLYELF